MLIIRYHTNYSISNLISELIALIFTICIYNKDGGNTMNTSKLKYQDCYLQLIDNFHNKLLTQSSRDLRHKSTKKYIKSYEHCVYVLLSTLLAYPSISLVLLFQLPTNTSNNICILFKIIYIISTLILFFASIIKEKMSKNIFFRALFIFCNTLFVYFFISDNISSNLSVTISISTILTIIIFKLFILVIINLLILEGIYVYYNNEINQNFTQYGSLTLKQNFNLCENFFAEYELIKHQESISAFNLYLKEFYKSINESPSLFTKFIIFTSFLIALKSYLYGDLTVFTDPIFTFLVENIFSNHPVYYIIIVLLLIIIFLLNIFKISNYYQKKNIYIKYSFAASLLFSYLELKKLPKKDIESLLG